MRDPNQSLRLGSYVSYMVVSRSIRLESFLPPFHAGKRHGKSLPCWENRLSNSYAIWFSWYGCLVWASHLWSIQAARLRMQMLLLRVLVLHVYFIEAERKVLDTLLFLGWQAPVCVELKGVKTYKQFYPLGMGVRRCVPLQLLEKVI